MRKSYWAAAASVALLSLPLADRAGAAGAAAPAATPPPAAPTPAAGSPALHRYVLAANAQLPVASRPMTAIFIDVGSVKRDGDVAKIDVIYALTAPATIEGRDTAYLAFHHTADCAKNMISLPNYTSYDTQGVAVEGVSKDPPRMAQPGSNDAVVLRFACDATARPAVGYADIRGVLAHAAHYGHVLAESAPGPHAFVLVGGGATSPYGPFDVFIDRSTMESTGDRVLAEAVEVFQPVDDVTKPAFDIDTIVYDCAGKTNQVVFSVLYKADGTPLRAALTGAAAMPVKPNTVSERMMQMACNRADPKLATAPTLPSAVLAARKAMQLAAAKSAGAPAPAPAPAPSAQASPPPSTTPAPVQK